MKKKLKTIVVKHIHSCFAAASSNDKWLYVIIPAKDVDFEAVQGKRIESIKHGFINDIAEEVSGDKQIRIIYLNSDETFSNRAKRENKIMGAEYHNTQDFSTLVNEYIRQGFNLTERPQELIDFYERKGKIEREKMKKDGFVLWMEYKERKPEDYKGGFSDSVFYTKEMQDYVLSGCVFGWIGHSVRKPELDKVIEEGLRERGLSSSKMHNWISSSDGRHFGDSLEGLSLKKQIVTIKKNLNRIYNRCLIYGHPNHGKTIQSSQTIFEEMQKKGWLLPEEK